MRLRHLLLVIPPVVWLELLTVFLVGQAFAGRVLWDFDPMRLQQTGEHNESATLPILAEIGIKRYGEIPLWNPYMLTGYPHSGDAVNHFWNPVSTLAIAVWGGLVGMKVSTYFSFLIAGYGQWFFGYVLRLHPVVRVWMAVLFMVSGGLALLWRIGWYGWLLGMVWIPWTYGSVWWALHRTDRWSIGLSALCIAMVLTTGGGYYPVYLGVTLPLLVAVALLFAPRRRLPLVARAVTIAVLAGALSAVSLLPLVDGLRYTRRDAPIDLQQRGSQPIPYALINYVVSHPDWFRVETLGTMSGWSWFYIGSLPFVGLAFASLAARSAALRPALFAVGTLTAVILVWHANRYTPVGWLYDRVQFLYTFRFPGRLLIVATSPILVLAGLGFHQFGQEAWAWAASRAKRMVRQRRARRRLSLSGAALLLLMQLAFVWALYASARDVFLVNRGFAFADQRIEPSTFEVLRWLKNRDSDLYYTNIGGGSILWWWTPAAYTLEMPIINFQYNRHLASQEKQVLPESPFRATPKYQIAQPNQPRPANAQQIHQFADMGVWELPDALPYAFAVSEDRVRARTPIRKQDVTALSARIDGPNRLVVRGTTAAGQHVVGLMSDYPGWELKVDGRPAPMKPVNGYLGAEGVPGEHTYTFEFRPRQHTIGLAFTVLGLLVVAGLASVDVRRWLRRRAETVVP